MISLNDKIDDESIWLDRQKAAYATEGILDQESYDLLENSHADAVESHHRFGVVEYDGQEWDLAHLRPYAFRQPIKLLGQDLEVYVLVFFSCHCFTRGQDPGEYVEKQYFYYDDREKRVLCQDRYELSQLLLPKMVHELRTREIRTTGSDLGNYMTIELTTRGGSTRPYIVFFDVEKDKRRKKRVILRVQSAHVRDELTNRMKQGGKVKFPVLISAAYRGEKIR